MERIATFRSPVIDGAFSRLFGTPVGRALDVLILHRGHDLSLKDLAEYAGVSEASLSTRVLPKLHRLGLVTHNLKEGHGTVSLNLKAGPVINQLVACEMTLSLKESESAH